MINKINKIKNKIIKNVISDNSVNNITFSFSILKNKFLILYLHNPNGTNIIIDDNNSVFFNKFIEMLFNKKDRSKGCFNHQYSDDDIQYYDSLQDLVNKYINIEYTFILIDLNEFIPVSSFCLRNNYIFSVCTNFNNRGKGLMKKLLTHFFLLLSKKKFKKNIDKVFIDIVHINPKFNQVKDFYEQLFDFKLLKKEDTKTVFYKTI